MASYESWNRAIINYFTSGMKKGASIFLSLDNEALEDIIAQCLLDESAYGTAMEDFIRSVREKCVKDSKVNLKAFHSSNSFTPQCVGFLGLMVLAAYQMKEEDNIDDNDYFVRFRELLSLDKGTGRPDYMKITSGTGPPDERLWKLWNGFLAINGFQPTAEQGIDGPNKYLNYPRSQVVLRKADKDFIYQKFRVADIRKNWDPNQIGFWISNNITRKYILKGLEHYDPYRVEEFRNAIYRIYESVDWDIQVDDQKNYVFRKDINKIVAGLYREVTISDDINYRIFPKQPQHCASREMKVSQNGEEKYLKTLSMGHFAPLWKQEPFVEEALEFVVTGNSTIHSMIFPKRDFWILTKDPDDIYGVWATWKNYLELDEKFIIICKKGLFTDEMNRFKKEQLLEWDESEIEDNGTWIEYPGCYIHSYDWGGFDVRQECRSLRDALTPRAPVSVSLSGGLRDPNQNAWLEGYPPAIKLYGFKNSFLLSLNEITGSVGTLINKREIECHKEINISEYYLEVLHPGWYKVSIFSDNQLLTERKFIIIPWDALTENIDVGLSPIETLKGGGAL